MDWNQFAKWNFSGYGNISLDPGSPGTVLYLETIRVALSLGMAVHKKAFKASKFSDFFCFLFKKIIIYPS